MYEHFMGKRQPAIKSNDPIQGWHSGFAQRHPDTDKFGEHWAAIETFSRFAALAEDDQFQSEIFTHLDRDRYIDLWILIQLCDDSDGLYQNRYFARQRGENARWIIIPWDKDGVWGRDYRMRKRPPDRWLSNHLFNRCLKIDSFRQDLVSRWRDLVRRGVISTEHIFAMIDENQSRIAYAAARNFKRWPADHPIYPDDTNFQQEIDYMKLWIEERIRRLDKKISSLME
jgi:hypothetical protein